MSKTLKIRKAVRDELIQIVERSYYAHAPAEVVKPYAVFLVDEVSTIDGCTVANLLIEVSDYGTDDTTVDSLCDAAQAVFDHWVYNDGVIEIASYLDSRKAITENDKLILRRRLEFELRIYGG